MSTLPSRPVRWLAWTLAALLGLAGTAPIAAARQNVAAFAGETTLPWRDLDRVLLDRYGYSEHGQAALQHLLKAEFLAWLAAERGVQVTDAEVSTRWAELDLEARRSGLPRGLLEEIESRGIEVDAFKELLRLGIVHERLTREALDLPADAPVTAGQQNVWIEEQMTEHGLSMPAPPWADGIAARCGPVTIDVERYALTLRSELPADDVRQTCLQILLVQRMRERMPDLAPEAESGAIEAEIERRRQEAAANPTYQGVDLESLLRAQGMVPERFGSDPAVVAAALARLWVDRNYGDAGLRKVYEAERRHFEELYGEAVLTHLIFLAAVRNPNELQPRSMEQAHATLNRLNDEIEGLESFAEHARAISDDRGTRERSGRLGWVTRGASGVPLLLREAVFESLGAQGPMPPGGRMFGPVELEGGVALLFLETLRPSPDWPEMADHVHRELRGRLASEVLPPDTVKTFLD